MHRKVVRSAKCIPNPVSDGKHHMINRKSTLFAYRIMAAHKVGNMCFDYGRVDFKLKKMLVQPKLNRKQLMNPGTKRKSK